MSAPRDLLHGPAYRLVGHPEIVRQGPESFGDFELQLRASAPAE